MGWQGYQGSAQRRRQKLWQIKGSGPRSLTINQDIPINSVANVTITFDISNLNVDLEALISGIGEMKNVVKIDLIAMEQKKYIKQ